MMQLCRSACSQLQRPVSGCISTAPVYDVAIVGGGMVGMSLAAALAADEMGKHLAVALIDRAPPPPPLPDAPQGAPDARVSTVTPSSIRLFKRCGAWQLMDPFSRPFSQMQVWDKRGHGYLRWHSEDVGQDIMGAVVENNVIQAACHRIARDADNVDFYWSRAIERLALPRCTAPASDADVAANKPTRNDLVVGALAELAISARSAPGPATPRATNAPPAPAQKPASEKRSSQVGNSGPDDAPTTLRARLVVAADGAQSRMRELAAFRTLGMAYNQRGIVATLATDPHETAWQRFLPSGPLALLPVRSGYSNIVWSTSPQHARSLEQLPPVAFADAVNEALRSAASDVPTAYGAVAPLLQMAGVAVSQGHGWFEPPLVREWVGSPPKSFPLQLKYAGKYVRPRFALVGDAAHAVHPLAGQGVNLGFGDVSRLSLALSDAVRVGRDVGEISLLTDEYERPRMRQNDAMMAALHSLNAVFGSSLDPVASVRNLGMGLINATPLVRNQLMKNAMGEM